MFYNDRLPLKEAKPTLKERRIKITEDQDKKLVDLESRLSIPASVLIRMALDSFFPKISNNGFTERGIKNGYLNGKY